MKSFPTDHQVRCVDLDRDGIDECVNGGYAIKGDGTVFWNMGSQSISHGDRWHIGAMDPNPSADLLGWGVGQSSGYDWYRYNAKTGTVLQKYGAGSADVNRGTCGDVDPTSPGYECWTAKDGIYSLDGSKNLKPGNGAAGTAVDSYDPAVNFRIWWDGDVLSENLDGNIVSKYAYPGMPSGGFTTVTLEGIYGARNAAPLYGDMFGDWREEVLLEKTDSTAFRVYTTAIPTEKRIYTLVHDPEYRNSMCEKGYVQSHMLDYYLGDGMTDPPRPNITYPDGCVGCAGAGGGGTTGAAGAGGGTSVVGGAGGGAGAAGGRGGSSGGRGGAGGTTGPVVTTVANTGGTVGPGGTSAGGPGTGGAAGGTPTTGANTVANTGGTVAIGSGGTTAVVPATGGGTGSGAEGGASAESGTSAAAAAASSGCSCAIGSAGRGTSAGYLVAMLGVLGLALNRRRRRGSSRN
jgi:MYXO-CTERM domain-containing protein